MEPQQFTVRVSDEVLTDLQERLARVRWPDEVLGGGWAYGADLTYLKDLVGYWREQFDWRAQEARLNQFRQYSVELAGIKLHFVHEPGVGPNPLPLLLSHGWPSTFWEFHQVIPMLTDPARFGGDPADAFTVVAPSLPGYAFSFQPNQPRFGVDEIADVFTTLMTEVLGYPQFVAEGGDWGAFITARMAFAHPEPLRAICLRLLPLPRDARRPANPTADELRYFGELDHWLQDETGYSAIQGTKPQTLAYGLADSPSGLAAWIVEKFRSWTDCGGDVESRVSKDDLLTTVMLYWVTGAIGSSFWPYYARIHQGYPIPPEGRVEVPTAYLDFPKEIVRQPRAWAERVFNLQRWTTMPSGGHFAPLEEPEALVREIRAFFRAFR